MSDGKMKVALMEDLGKIGFTKRDIPVAKANEVLVKIESVGICGSDLHYYETGAIGPFVVKPPFVLGHEAGGVVAAVGSEVKHLAVGDKVALEPGIPCGHCEFCRTGKYNLCPDVIFFATPPVDGIFQEYVAHPADFCFKLPENLDTVEGAMIEPLAVGFHAATEGGAALGQTAVVFGAGCIGLTSTMACKAKGISKVIVVDIMDKRLETAKKLGATHIINGAKEDVVAKIMELTNGRGVDLCIETSGVEIAANQCIFASAKGAVIVLVGYSGTGKMTLEINHALDKEVVFKTIFRYRHLYPMCIEAAATGKVDLKAMVSHTFRFDDLQEALDECVRDKANIVKGVIKMVP